MALKPPVEVPQGAIRLNTDSQKLEFFAQDQWWEMATSAALTTGSGRAVFGGSYNYPGNCVDVIDYIQISTQGDAIDFGNLTQSQGTGTSFGSVTRAIWAGGTTNGGPKQNNIQYVEIPTAGNATDFGDMTYSAGHGVGGCSNQVRGLNAGGNPQTNTINYVTIASKSNAIDFGDITNARYGLGGVASQTRGVFSYGDLGPAFTNIMDYVTIASTGNAQDFGDYTGGTSSGTGGSSNNTRGLWCGGTPSGEPIHYITIATTGNSTDFGNTWIAHSSNSQNRFAAGAGGPTRAIWCGGYQWTSPSGTTNNVISYSTYSTLGNTADFGDLTGSYSQHYGTSNCHGGL